VVGKDCSPIRSRKMRWRTSSSGRLSVQKGGSAGSVASRSGCWPAGVATGPVAPAARAGEYRGCSSWVTL
jgi:hypothetical protein